MTYKPYKILVGIAGPLSGERIAHAPLVHHAADCLQRKNISHIVEDDRAEIKTALEVARRFIEKNVVAVIGHFNSACAQAVKSLYREAGIPVFLPASTQTDLMKNTDGFYFRMCSTDFEQAKLALSIAKRNYSPQFCELAVDDTPYAGRLLDAFRQQNPDILSRIVTIYDRPAKDTCVRIVLATCTNSIMASKILHDAEWAGTAIYMDDSHVDAFAENYFPLEYGDDFVIGPKDDYESLITQACNIVEQGIAYDKEFLLWLSRMEFFDAQGDRKDAAWQLYSMIGREFIACNNF